jgi:SulP family sulfate permease
LFSTPGLFLKAAFGPDTAKGGLTGFLQSGATILASELDARRLPLGFGFVGVLLLTFFFVSEIVSVVPTFVATGLLLFIGLVMLDAWLIGSWKRMMPIDRFTVVGIVGLTAAFGILPAVAIGLLIALLSFALGFIRLPVICAVSDGSAIRSVVDRSQHETEILSERSDAIQVLKLQGALFFGSVDSLKDVITRLLDRVPNTAFLILDASEVNTIDSAACAAFDKLHFLTANRGVALIITRLKPGQRAVFEKWGTHLDDDLRGDCEAITAYPTLDRALEDCEDLVLERSLGLDRQWRVEDVLSRLGDGHPRVPDLVALLSPVHLVDGERLIRKGETDGDIFILESGRLVVRLVTPEGDTLRVRAMAPGSLVGESAHILGTPRNADVVAEGPVTAWRLGVQALADMETNDRDLAALTFAILAHALALKVAQTNDIISGLTGRGLHDSKIDYR